MLEDLIKAREKCAQIVATYGDVYLPIFERLDQEIATIESRQNALDRARAIAAQSSRSNPLKTGHKMVHKMAHKTGTNFAQNDQF